jgi:hypothetical protein
VTCQSAGRGRHATLTQSPSPKTPRGVKPLPPKWHLAFVLGACAVIRLVYEGTESFNAAGLASSASILLLIGVMRRQEMPSDQHRPIHGDRQVPGRFVFNALLYMLLIVAIAAVLGQLTDRGWSVVAIFAGITIPANWLARLNVKYQSGEQ